MVLKSMVTHPTHLNKLAVFNNKILRILQCAARDSQYLYTNFNTLTDNLHKFKVLLFVHKFFHHPDQLPPIFVIIFCIKKNSDLHSHDTRSKDKLHFQSFTTSLGQRSIKYKGCYLWCSLPDQLKSITSTNSSLKKKYLQSQ